MVPCTYSTVWLACVGTSGETCFTRTSEAPPGMGEWKDGPVPWIHLAFTSRSLSAGPSAATATLPRVFIRRASFRLMLSGFAKVSVLFGAGRRSNRLFYRKRWTASTLAVGLRAFFLLL